MHMHRRRCPNCQQCFSCDYLQTPYHYPKCPQCEICAKRYETELATERRLSERLAFLKLQDADPSTELFKGDVAFAVDGCEKIHAHRFILAAKSSVFFRMFDCAMVEKETGLIPIDDATYPVMRAVINHCYTADINFTDEVPPDQVLKVAHKYEISHLRDVCAEELCGRISEGNLAEMLRLSKRYEVKNLQEASVKYLKEHLDTVFSTVMETLYM